MNHWIVALGLASTSHMNVTFSSTPLVRSSGRFVHLGRAAGTAANAHIWEFASVYPWGSDQDLRSELATGTPISSFTHLPFYSLFSQYSAQFSSSLISFKHLSINFGNMFIVQVKTLSQSRNKIH